MAPTLTCPRCGTVVDSAVEHSQFVCPNCRHQFSTSPISNMELDSDSTTVKPISPPDEEIPGVLPAPPSSVPPPLPSTEPPPLPSQGIPQSTDHASYSESVPGFLPTGHSPVAPGFESATPNHEFDYFNEEVNDENTAKHLLARWKKQMPQVDSAYQPSGVLPASALLLMIWGFVFSIVMALVAEAVVGVLAIAIVALLAVINAVALMGGFIFCIWVIILILVLIVALVAPFIAGGWAAAWTTTLFGRWGKNRNVTVPSLLSILSAAISVPVAGFLFVLVAKEPLDQWQPFGFHPETLHTIYWIVGGIGFLVAIVSAFAVALTIVEGAKFCEDCECYMDKSPLKTLHAGGMRATVQALTDKNIDLAVHMLDRTSGENGNVTLFCCPRCFKGYLEVWVHFKAHWYKKSPGMFQSKEEKHDLQEDWLAASIELESADVQRFQTWLETQ